MSAMVTVKYWEDDQHQWFATLLADGIEVGETKGPFPDEATVKDWVQRWIDGYGPRVRRVAVN